MRVVTDFLSEPAFEVFSPREQTSPFVFNSPHSGTAYPQAFLDASRLDAARIRLSEDAHVDKLFMHAVDAGSPLLRALFPRAYLDVNREPYELDPRMFDGRLPPFANIRSIRVAGGLGTVPRVISDAEEIYAGPMPVEAALDRIETLYKPYHAALTRLLAQTHVRFGRAVLIDCHSMPSSVKGTEGRARYDFVLGDRHGTSAARALIDHVANALGGLGYKVSINRPYAGGFITEHYGNPAHGAHAVQVELNRAIYMDERRRERSERFSDVIDDFALLAEALAEVPWGDLGTMQAAAE